MCTCCSIRSAVNASHNFSPTPTPCLFLTKPWRWLVVTENKWPRPLQHGHSSCSPLGLLPVPLFQMAFPQITSCTGTIQVLWEGPKDDPICGAFCKKKTCSFESLMNTKAMWLHCWALPGSEGAVGGGPRKFSSFSFTGHPAGLVWSCFHMSAPGSWGQSLRSGLAGHGGRVCTQFCWTLPAASLQESATLCSQPRRTDVCVSP